MIDFWKMNKYDKMFAIGFILVIVSMAGAWLYTPAQPIDLAQFGINYVYYDATAWVILYLVGITISGFSLILENRSKRNEQD